MANTKLPGVGYTPRIGALVQWIEKRPGSGKLINRTNEFMNTGTIDLTDKRQFELRYGKDSFAIPNGLRWRFVYDNELFGVVVQALTHAFQMGRLGNPAKFDGTPTRLEVQDAMATTECLQLVQKYFFEADIPGNRRENPQKVKDTSRATGEVWSENLPYWSMPWWYINVAKSSKPIEKPPVDPPVNPPTDPIVSPVDTPRKLSSVAQRTEELMEHAREDFNIILRFTSSPLIAMLANFLDYRLTLPKTFLRVVITVKRKFMGEPTD